MRFSHIIKPLGAAAAVISLTLFDASPASAATSWQTYQSNSRWHCGTTTDTAVSDNVVFQTCIVAGAANNTAQAVLVVSNRGTKAVVLKKGIVESDDLYDGERFACYQPAGGYVLSGGQARACFGRTDTLWGCGRTYQAKGILYANNLGADETLPANYDHLC